MNKYWSDRESLFFKGYSRSNLIKLFLLVLVRWNQNFGFLIKYKICPGLDLEETHLEIEILTNLLRQLKMYLKF